MNVHRFLAASLIFLTGAAAVRAELPSLESFRQRLKSGEATRIVCFGDSITGAYYHTGGVRAWCDLLGIALGQVYPKAKIEVVNAGISGHTTENALARIDADVLAKEPHLVVVMFGMNDVTRLSHDVFEANLRTIVEKCADRGAYVVLCTPNSVYENAARPNAKLAEIAERTRKLAREMELPLADCFEDYLRRRETDEMAWKLTMSDEIHPNIHGHARFAETIAATISGEAVTLDEVPPLDDALAHTLGKLGRGEPVRIVAMAPYDKSIPAALRSVFPEAKLEVVTWPTESGRVGEMRAWAEGIRGLAPDLVVPAVPAEATTGAGEEDPGTYIQDYEWVLNYSFPFAGRQWDVLPILPDVAAPVREAEHGAASARLALASEIVRGKDVVFLERAAGDERTAGQIVASFVAERVAAQAAKPLVDSKAPTP
jgi:acyl-CoA thioesterase-1